MRFVIFVLLMATSAMSFAKGVYLSSEAFVKEVFAGTPPAPEMLWLTGKKREHAEQILQHRPASLRTRYWKKEQRTVWILEEVGKDKPITVGLVINRNKIERIRVLVFRESRGDEVRHDFFTNQFNQAGLTKDHRLTKKIDGITGATLSVRALTKLAALALYLHTEVSKENDAQ
ncbi:MAG: FMN-binding protein [Gammaproteobacteria bacterium]|nr:FMN-binding protein [Gammaproteobacteria bacterium]